MGRRSYLVIAALVLGLAFLPTIPALGQVLRDERRGLILDGLRQLASGPCGAAFELVPRVSGERVRCTHGPDPAPDGVDVRQRRQVMADAPSPRSSTVAADQPGIACYGNGTDGYRVQLLYARQTGTTDQLASYYSSFVTWTANADVAFNASAAKTGGTRHLRFVTDASCGLVVTAVQVSAAAMDDFSSFVTELDGQGFNRSDRKYLVWADANRYCGIAELYDDDSHEPAPGLPWSNANNGRPTIPGTFARVDNGCWGLANSVEVHELVHVMGGVQQSAPNATQGYHCTDDADRMCYLDGSPPGTLFEVCSALSDENRLDCNDDDYFHTSPTAGTYLGTHWNVANSAFLAPSDPPAPPLVSSSEAKQFRALVGLGAETTQEVMNALAGEHNGLLYPPLRSSAESGGRQITSWDAVGGPCVTPKAPGATFNRPNGSITGLRALSRAIDGTIYGDASCGTAKIVTGLADFARSSVGPTDVGNALTYIPFGRDAVSFAYYADGVASPVTSLTRAQLTSLFGSGPQTIAGVKVVACGIPRQSGTYALWNLVAGVTASQETIATMSCNDAGVAGRLQENDAAALKAKALAIPGNEQVVVVFSSPSFISQSNGVSLSQLAAGVDLGAISDNGGGTNLGKPYEGTAPNLTPAAAFYGDDIFGRPVYNVFATSRVTGVGNVDVKSLFVGATASICSTPAQIVVNAFGFLSVGNCGSTATAGGLISGTT